MNLSLIKGALGKKKEIPEENNVISDYRSLCLVNSRQEGLSFLI